MKTRALKLFGIVFAVNIALGIVQWKLRCPLKEITQFIIISYVIYGFLNIYFWICDMNNSYGKIQYWIFAGIPATIIFGASTLLGILHREPKGLFSLMCMISMNTTFINWYIYLSGKE